MGEFSPYHWLVVLFIAACMCGITPFIAGYFVGRYVERKKSTQRGAGVLPMHLTIPATTVKLAKGFALDIPPGYEARSQEPEAKIARV
jgi:hypothetical protein